MSYNIIMSSNQEKVFQLCTELEEIKKRKKQVTRAFNDEIRRLQDEIKDIIVPDEAVDITKEDLV
jgi:hypothetical protein